MILKNEGSPACLESHIKSSDVTVCCNEDDTFPQGRRACLGAFAPDYNRMIQEESCIPVSSMAKGNESHSDGELIHNDSKDIDGIVHATPNRVVNCFRSLTSDTADD
jgi:hypothetical protein